MQVEGGGGRGLEASRRCLLPLAPREHLLVLMLHHEAGAGVVVTLLARRRGHAAFAVAKALDPAAPQGVGEALGPLGLVREDDPRREIAEGAMLRPTHVPSLGPEATRSQGEAVSRAGLGSDVASVV